MTTAGPPLLTVLRGAPTPEEVAALVAALSLLRASATAPPPPISRWGDRATGLRAPMPAGDGAAGAGSGAWRAAG